MYRFFLLAITASCGGESTARLGSHMATSDFPPDGYEVTGTGVTWADDFSITEGIGTISSVADAGGGDIRVQTGAAHGLVVGQYVRLQGTTSYDGEYVITAVSDTTHFDITATYVATDTGTIYTNFCGPDSVRFEPSTDQPEYVYDTSIGINENQPLRMSALVQVSSISGSAGWFAIRVKWYDADDSYMSATNVWSGQVSASGEWLRLSGLVTVPVGARGARPSIVRLYVGTTNYAWLDDIALEEVPIAFSVYRSSNQTGMASTGAHVQFNAEDFDYGSNFDVSTYAFIVPSDGIYTMNARCQVAFLDTDEYAQLSLRWSDDGWSSSRFLSIGQDFFSRQDTWPPTVVVTYTGPLARGDQVRAYLVHGHSTTVSAAGDATGYRKTAFAGFLVE
jgi:hypothetical protein